ncbi:MAG TPA: polysaccharide deacetylase family protein [Atopostipes sp.]|nr:polysaccharide deacetylase family protein [Atopostipes sp.]
MKKKIYSTILLSAFLLAGCQGEAVETNGNEDAESTDSSEQVIDEENTDSNDNDNDNQNDNDNDNNNDNKDNETEEVSYQYQINPETFSVEPIEGAEENEEKLVLLTFDDAPYGNTMAITEALAERDVSAIFFVNGMYMEDEEGFETIQEVHEMGFEIANHTHTHAKLDDYSESAQLEEIVKTSDIIEEAIGEEPRFFRAPHGVMTEYAKQAVEDEGMTWMNWSFGYDWMPEYQEGSALADITLNTELLTDGVNILMHDREWTADAVPEIVDGLLEQGYTIVDPSLILNEHGDE